LTNLVIREWINGVLIPLNICIMIIIAHSLFDSYRRYGIGWAKQPGIGSACALWWIFGADLIRSCLAWSFLHGQNLGRPTSHYSYSTTLLYIFAGSIAAAATFRLIFTLSPSSWGHKGWIAAAILTAVFMTAFAVIG
jgi:hypothetical protein